MLSQNWAFDITVSHFELKMLEDNEFEMSLCHAYEI